MTAGHRGANRERQVMAQLRAEGWIVYRAAGSHGHADLVALRADVRPRLVQVKTSGRGPFEHFRPVEREALIEEALAAGAEPWLAWWPARRPCTWWQVGTWPPTAKALTLRRRDTHEDLGVPR